MTPTPADLAAHERRPRPVPLRASVVALVAEVHTQAARDARSRSERALRMSADVDDPYWHGLYLTSAAESEVKADRHEATAREWLARVV